MVVAACVKLASLQVAFSEAAFIPDDNGAIALP